MSIGGLCVCVGGGEKYYDEIKTITMIWIIWGRENYTVHKIKKKKQNRCNPLIKGLPVQTEVNARD